MGHDACTERASPQITISRLHLRGTGRPPCIPRRNAYTPPDHRRRTAKAQIDPVTMDSVAVFQNWPCNGQGRDGWEHDPKPRRDADSRCMISDMPDQTDCRSRCELPGML